MGYATLLTLACALAWSSGTAQAGTLIDCRDTVKLSESDLTMCKQIVDPNKAKKEVYARIDCLAKTEDKYIIRICKNVDREAQVRLMKRARLH